MQGIPGGFSRRRLFSRPGFRILSVRLFTMTTLYRHEALWQGLPGLTGFSTFYSLTAANPAAIRTFFGAVQALIPTPCTIQVSGSGDTIDEATGTLTGTWTAATPTLVSCTGTTYAAPCGGLVTWTTSTVRRGRILKGRTFLVPMWSGAYTTAGNIASGNVSTIQAAATALVSAFSGTLVVWGRPILDYSTKPPTTVAPGVSGVVTGAVAQSKVVTLRTRRD